MATMDTIANAILKEPDSEEGLRRLVQLLRGSEEVLFRNAMHLDELTQTLHAPKHTLGLVFVLIVRASALDQAQANAPPALAFVQQCRELLVNADPVQMRLAPAEVARLCAKLVAFAHKADTCISAVRPLCVAAAKLQPAATHFTPVHPLALQASILARCYHAGAPLIDGPLIHVDASKTAVTPNDVLLTQYYGGVVLVGLRRHAEALHSFQLALTAPTLVVNNIMVEAYKKWLLCGLIAHKQNPVLPKYTANVVARNCKSLAQPYTDLAAAFAARTRPKLEQVFQQHAALFEREGNLGLVKQAMTAFTKSCIERLTRTYMTLSLDDIAEAAGYASRAEAEAMVLRMVARGEISARIDRAQGMAEFGGSDEADAGDTKCDLEARLAEVTTLSKLVRALQDELASDVNYLTKTTDKGDRGGSRWMAERGDEAMAGFSGGV